MDTLLYPRFVLAHDDFYADPGAVYRAALQARYHEPENSTGFRSTRVYHERGVKARLEKILGVRIKRWDTDPADGSGIFCVGLSTGRHKEQPGVHADFPWNDITVVVYLTPGLPPDCGTSLWVHRATGLADPPSQADVRRPGADPNRAAGLAGARQPLSTAPRCATGACTRPSLHCLLLDGVYRGGSDGAPEFVEVPAPSDEALQSVLHKLITRTMKLLTRRGVLIEEQGQTYLADTDGDLDAARVLARRC